jgi:hypothetical protein
MIWGLSGTLRPSGPLDGITRLEFSKDGNVLTAISQTSWQMPPSYRVWDISRERRDQIDAYDEIGLVAEGCVLARLEDGNNQFSIEEARLIYQQSFHQPCKD